MDMQMTDAAGGKAIKIVLAGRLDTAGVDAVETRFNAAAVAGGRSTIVDLSGLETMTSMGIRMLIGAARAMGRRQTMLVLFGARDLVAEVIETAAIDTLIAVVPEESDALALLPH